MINIDTTSGEIHWMYGFPTMGKTTAQRTLRYLTKKQREEYGYEDVIDASDTDEWLGVFKMSQNPDMHVQIYRRLFDDAMLAQHLASDHCRVVFTNVWRIFSETGIKPHAVFVPASADIIAERVKARGDKNADWIIDNTTKWLDNLTNSDWFKQQDTVVTIDGDRHISDYLSINGVKLHHMFYRDGAIRTLNNTNII